MDRERDIPAFALECCMAFRNRDGILSWLFLSDVVVGVIIDLGLLVVVDDALVAFEQTNPAGCRQHGSHRGGAPGYMLPDWLSSASKPHQSSASGWPTPC